MPRFGQEFHCVPAIFHLLLNDRWPHRDDSWSPGFSEPAVLVADLDLDQRRDWLELFPFLRTRRPDAYGPLVTS